MVGAYLGEALYHINLCGCKGGGVGKGMSLELVYGTGPSVLHGVGCRVVC